MSQKHHLYTVVECTILNGSNEGYDRLRDVLSMSVEEFDDLNLDLLM